MKETNMIWHYTKDSVPDSDREVLIAIYDRQYNFSNIFSAYYTKGIWISPFDDNLKQNHVYCWAELSTPPPCPS